MYRPTSAGEPARASDDLSKTSEALDSSCIASCWPQNRIHLCARCFRLRGCLEPVACTVRSTTSCLRDEAQEVTSPAPSDGHVGRRDRKSTRLNSSHANISYAVFCLKKKKILHRQIELQKR